MVDTRKPGSENLMEICEHYGAHNYHPLPIVLARGEGIWVWDVEGKKYLDMLSAYSALNQGHRHPRIIQALKDQADKLTLTSRAFYVEAMAPFLQKVTEMCGMEVALPMNTGAEAVETAIKMARKWGYEKKGVDDDRAEIIVFKNNFHGRTTTVVGFSTEEAYRTGFGPFTPGFRVIEYGDAAQLSAAIGKNTVAVLMEPIQGEGGILIPPAGYLKAARDLCTRHNVLFMLDEIQTGLGRTGRLFAYQHENIEPDVLILGKALGGGVLPVSVVVSSREIMGVFRPGEHGSTFGGFPLACAVASAAIDVLLDENLTENAAETGAYFLERLRAMRSPHVQDIRGKGLLIGVEVKRSSGMARPFCERLMANGLLCKETHESVVRFAPPLVIEKSDIDWAMKRIEAVFR